MPPAPECASICQVHDNSRRLSTDDANGAIAIMRTFHADQIADQIDDQIVARQNPAKDQEHAMSSPKNRRQHPRLLTTRPLKLFHRAGGRFLPAVATDLSDGGVLVTITWPCRFIVGEAIDIYLPPDNHVMLSSKHRAPARVVRVLHGEQVTMAAIQFDQPLTQTVLRQERAAA